MEKDYIFFDLDGMKFNSLPAYVLYINNRWNIKTELEHYFDKGSRLEEIVREHTGNHLLTRDEVFGDFKKNFLTSIDWHKNILPMPDMVEVIKELASKYKLYTVTARHREGLHVINYLIGKYIPNCISYVHCVSDIVDGKHISISKRDFISSIQGNKIAFLDDSLHEIEDTMDIIPSYLFDPNNLHKDNADIFRVDSFKQIGELFL